MRAIMQPLICSAAIASGFKQWRSVIRAGNRAFESADYSSAIRSYQVACSIAQGLFGGDEEADSGVAILVISHHNLADAYGLLGCDEEQALQLCAIHERLCQAMEDPELDESWRSAALRHSRRTYAELTCFVRHHPWHTRARITMVLGATAPQSALHIH